MQSLDEKLKIISQVELASRINKPVKLLCTILLAVFIALRLIGEISWPWLIVLSPFITPLVSYIVIAFPISTFVVRRK